MMHITSILREADTEQVRAIKIIFHDFRMKGMWAFGVSLYQPTAKDDENKETKRFAGFPSP